MNTKRVVLIVLAGIGGLVSLWVVGMWLMYSLMIGSGRHDGLDGLSCILFTAASAAGSRGAGDGDYSLTPQLIEMRFS